jgi:hypothetical protein
MRKRLSVLVLEHTLEGLKTAAKSRDLSIGRLVDRAVHHYLHLKTEPPWPPKPRRVRVRRGLSRDSSEPRKGGAKSEAGQGDQGYGQA